MKKIIKKVVGIVRNKLADEQGKMETSPEEIAVIMAARFEDPATCREGVREQSASCRQVSVSSVPGLAVGLVAAIRAVAE